MFFGLRKYQIEAVQFIVDTPRCALWVPMGLGKSLMTLSALMELGDRAGRILICGPKRVVRHVWSEEVRKWGFDYSVAICDGTPKQKRKAIASGADITCISVDSLKYAVEAGDWGTLIVDEATLVKSPKSQRWKNAKRISQQADRVIELTGSPTAGAGLVDVWGQADLLFPDGSNPLGTFYQFQNRYFRFDHFNRPHAKRGAEQKVGEVLAPWIFRRDLSEIRMPGLHTSDIVVDMNEEQERATLAAELEEDGTFVRLRTISGGFLYEAHWSGSVDTVWISDSKVEALEEIVRETRGENLLVLCQFQAEADMLRDRFKAAVLDGRTSAKSATRIIEDWNAGKLSMLVGNSAAMSHGLNLQSGGHRIVWYSLPVSQEQYEQANARLFRSGQQAGTVFVHRIVAQHSIDEAIAGLLSKKMLSQAALMEAVQLIDMSA